MRRCVARHAGTLRALARCREGAAILEFALVLPILLLLVGACFEIGRALLIYQSMTEAVRSGARTLARLPDPTCRDGCAPGVTG
ncbi:TadE/TadG family type IV pilus assembly protein, partial [Methylobacterium trifolii]